MCNIKKLNSYNIEQYNIKTRNIPVVTRNQSKQLNSRTNDNQPTPIVHIQKTNDEDDYKKCINTFIRNELKINNIIESNVNELRKYEKNCDKLHSPFICCVTGFKCRPKRCICVPKTYLSTVPDNSLLVAVCRDCDRPISYDDMRLYY